MAFGLHQAGAALYARPDKPFEVAGEHERPRYDTPEPLDIVQPLTVDKGTDCFVTPARVALRMAGYAELRRGLHVLEPEAGTGNIAQAILDLCAGVKLHVNEQHHALFNALVQRIGTQATATQGDFLEYQGGPFDRITMNPPFSRRQAHSHIAHARTLLKPDGYITALVPVTVQVDGMTELERLGPDTFDGTKVHTKIIEVRN